MSSHQANQSNPAGGQTYQYSWGDQILEIPSNINYQLENVLTSGGVSWACIFSDLHFPILIEAWEAKLYSNLTYKSRFNMWNHIRMRTHNLDPAFLIIFILCLYVIYLFMCTRARATTTRTTALCNWKLMLRCLTGTIHSLGRIHSGTEGEQKG